MPYRHVPEHGNASLILSFQFVGCCHPRHRVLQLACVLQPNREMPPDPKEDREGAATGLASALRNVAYREFSASILTVEHLGGCATETKANVQNQDVWSASNSTRQYYRAF